MLNNKDTGFFGENEAAQFLVKNGFDIVCRNWRYKHLEIDIVASKQQILHIIEVKTRSKTNFGLPESFVDKNKMQFMKNAAAHFQYQYPNWKYIQFDIVAIHLNPEKKWEIFFIEDVYF